MATKSANAAANFTTTSSSPSQPIRTSRPRFSNLSSTEQSLFFEYIQFVFHVSGEDDDSTRAQKEETLSKLTKEQKRTFPILAEEDHILFLLRKSQLLKDSLAELEHELRLEAENDIDHSRDRI